MKKSAEQKLQELEAKIRILQHENDSLSERAEEMLLLGLVAETLESASEENILLEKILEKIAILKKIPFSACCYLKATKAVPFSWYALFCDEESLNPVMTFSDGLIRLIQNDKPNTRKISRKNGAVQFNFTHPDFSPAFAAVVPFSTRNISEAFFLFVSDEKENPFKGMMPLLKQICKMSAKRLDEISLLAELKSLNLDLESRVRERTSELTRSNRMLRREIQERVETEKALRLSEAKFRQLFNDLPDGIFICRMNGPNVGNILDANPAAVKQTGYTRKELIGKNIIRDLAVTPNNQDKVNAEVRRLEKGQTVHLIEKKRRKDGSIYWTEVLITGMELDGTPVGVSVNRDITLQVEQEERIRILSRSVEQSPVSVVITDLEGCIEYVNPKFEKVTGYTLEEVRGRKPSLLKSGATPPEIYAELWQTITNGKEWRGEFQNRRKDGVLFWEFASISPIKDDQGKITHYLGVKEDVTERKLLQQQLNQSQKIESIGRLAGGIAHDFNNLLTVINGHAELAATVLPREHAISKHISAIADAGSRAQNLTSQLLAFSRKQIYQPKILDINQIISDMNNILPRLLGENICIESILRPDVPPILADPGQVEQVLLNLLLNARDAIEENSRPNAKRNIIIETSRINLDRQYVAKHPGSTAGLHTCIAISDTGFGMSDEVKNKIFEPFFTTKEVGRGTGLGLSTVYGIVKQNQGSIFVYSEPGHGTTFKIYWPAVKEIEKGDEHVETPENLKKGTEVILLVEDDSDVRSFTSEALQQLNYTVYEADSAERAIQVMEEQDISFHLLVTDLIMPGLSGNELAQQFTSKYPEAGVLYCSGHTENHIVKSGALGGNLHFIQKPYTLQKLADKVREALGK